MSDDSQNWPKSILIKAVKIAIFLIVLMILWEILMYFLPVA